MKTVEDYLAEADKQIEALQKVTGKHLIDASFKLLFARILRLEDQIEVLSKSISKEGHE